MFNENVLIISYINIIMITNASSDDDVERTGSDKNSERYKDDEIETQIAVINPSNRHKNELKEGHELPSYLSHANSSIADQSQYPSSNNSTNKSFHTFSSIRKFKVCFHVFHTKKIPCKIHNNFKYLP